ncbi:MAG TPA: type II toxin-antitoxin system VapC family toxin [Candidatus Nanopelagicales bacterium]|nr:type II toxin-antitoxin system VapC family toxin [Candidatus Nanopelagicales bacterium]
MIIADTNVVSEFMKDSPHPAVLAWAERLSASELTICVVTVEEIERGIGLLPTGRRRRELQRRWAALVDGFAETIVPYDLAASRQTASVLVAAHATGRPMSLADAQIAGICLSGTLTLATRNIADFAAVDGLAVVNPFSAGPANY